MNNYSVINLRRFNPHKITRSAFILITNENSNKELASELAVDLMTYIKSNTNMVHVKDESIWKTPELYLPNNTIYNSDCPVEKFMDNVLCNRKKSRKNGYPNNLNTLSIYEENYINDPAFNNSKSFSYMCYNGSVMNLTRIFQIPHSTEKLPFYISIHVDYIFISPTQNKNNLVKLYNLWVSCLMSLDIFIQILDQFKDGEYMVINYTHPSGQPLPSMYWYSPNTDKRIKKAVKKNNIQSSNILPCNTKNNTTHVAKLKIDSIVELMTHINNTQQQKDKKENIKEDIKEENKETENTKSPLLIANELGDYEIVENETLEDNII
jgi:hypothetical protein